MKQQITLDSKEVRKIIAKFFGIPEEQVVPLRYNFAIEGMSAEEIERKMAELDEKSVSSSLR